jgi:hypothetical protein
MHIYVFLLVNDFANHGMSGLFGIIIHINIWIRVFICKHTYGHADRHAFICNVHKLCIYIYMYIYKYIYIYIYMYKYIYTCKCIYMYKRL